MTPDIELKMKLLAGQEIEIDGVPIKPRKLGDIARIGYNHYQQSINLLTIDLDSMISSIDNFEFQALMKANKHQYKVFDLYMMSSEMQSLVVDGFKLVFDSENILLDKTEFEGDRIIVDNKYIISRDNFDDIINVIKMQNSPELSKSKEGEDEYKPSNELARSIAEKIKKGKKIVKESKAIEDDSKGITITDVISAVTAMSNSINKINVWEYTIYQLYEEFSRLNAIDNYRLQVQASMWSSEVEVEHWSEPL